ncbi:OmpH family outer membrane protein [Hippea maritima]|uniref:Outer membrane chaperone Skp (OmpH) n=1 Tax=Hippea maritima (strain ATCC 700847 / DSM 10411 / MH2) TaxID=760142 RepID=F2LXD6_HIPMA|nr:OmpH family outer membrane protein [Hippea maritima]AEA34250.1 outer membrane chaperone Skp (OmpH) [Hippea maritima DSM 10411]
MRRILMTLLIATLLGGFYLKAQASNIAFVNLRLILQESKSGKQAKSEVEAIIQAKKMVIEKKANDLKAILKKLKNKKLSKTEKEKLQKEYETKLNDLQQYQSKASQEVRKKEVEQTNKVLSLAIGTIKNYAKKHHIDGVFELSQGNVIYWNDALDITKTIIKLMDSSKNTKK